jgi:uncharacterized protein
MLMPIATTYPGVYLEELESGQHNVTAASTNIAAFVGRALFGPTDLPQTINSYGDFQRAYGGLQFDYPMSYAVQDFFANGGSEAIIARLFEPTEGDGFAQLKFKGGPPMLPEEWMLDANTKAGTSKDIALAAPKGSAGDPDVGMTMCFGGDPQKYLVIAYTPAVPGKSPALVTIVPPLSSSYRKCTALAFDYGPSPTGWTVLSTAGNKVILTGGSGLPELGDVFTFSGDSTQTAYAAISVPTVDPGTMQVTVTLSPAPKIGSVNFGAAATISDPSPLPAPVGWEIDQFVKGAQPSAGSITLINGAGAAQVGDQFTMPAAPRVSYVVTAFQAADSKNPNTTLTFKSMSGDALDPDAFCHCCPPNFSRPAPKNYSVKAGPKVGEISFTAQSGPATLGVIDIGDSFTVDGDSTEYSVRFVDPAGTIYFLPKAVKAFSSANAITFFPPLTLIAANPGEWGNYVSAVVDSDGITDKTAKQFKQDYGLEPNDLFNLTLTRNNARGQVLKTERYLNLSVKTTGDAARFPNRIDRVLASDSVLARVGALSAIPPGHGAAAQGIGGNDGTYLSTATYLGNSDSKTGIYLLEHAHIFNLLCIPPDRRILPDVPDSEQDLDPAVNQAAARYCTDRRAFYIVDPPVAWKNKAAQGQLSAISPEDVGITGENNNGIEVARNAAVYFPRICMEDILMKSQPALFAPCGAVAGVMAATDVGRGVWKAPAGIETGLANVTKLEISLTDADNGKLNPLGINCLRKFPIIGSVIWGARTLRGADQFEDDYKYIPVRRLTLFIENSLIASTQWAVFEPNDEALWSSLRLSVGSFLADLSRQGAFYDYKVKCDASTTTPEDIENGIVNILVMIAPVDPAEFVVIQIQQMAGGTPS